MYAGVLGAVGGAFVDAHRNKGEVAALEKRAKEASEASQKEASRGTFTGESAEILQ